MKQIFKWFSSADDASSISQTDKDKIELKRSLAVVNFIHPGHPLYDNILMAEKNQLHILAPNEAAYNEDSLIHKFVATVIYKDMSFLVVNSFKHFKEQSIGGLLQYDENIYTVIPFFEDEEEYQTAVEYTYKETYEYDHPVESYALLVTTDNVTKKLLIDRGKKPLTVKMVDEFRTLFNEKLNKVETELIDYIVIPTIEAYQDIQKKRNTKVS